MAIRAKLEVGLSMQGRVHGPVISQVSRVISGILTIATIAILLIPWQCMAAERINMLLLVQDSRIDKFRKFFDGEPSVTYSVVVTRDPQLPDSEILKLIRLYFPRSYTEFKDYRVLVLAKPGYDYFTPKQDGWIHDAVYDGAGGINDGSVFSQIAGIPEAWSNGRAWQAFPNDAPTVTANYGAWASTAAYSVQINREHPEPVLTVFIPFGVEMTVSGISRVVIPRQGSSVLAWQLGNYPGREPYLVSWDYGDGRSMTIGNPIPGGWLKYPTGTADNQYSPEMLMNMIYWLAGTELIDDVEVFHKVKSYFTEFRARLKVLVSLTEFIDRFGASTTRIREEVAALEEVYAEASGHYLDHSFVDSEIQIKRALDGLPSAEEEARREKERALAWVYAIEWLVSASVFFISGFSLWTLMVRRRLYRDVQVTKLRMQGK